MAILEKIISGGQTGVDRAALDVALELAVPCGGWCPLGRTAEDGLLESKYPLQETPSGNYAQRTEWNVRDSDATLILTVGKLTCGTALTKSLADRYRKPCLVVDPQADRASDQIIAWIEGHHIAILNVAGSRESQRPGIYNKAKRLLRILLDPNDKPFIDKGTTMLDAVLHNYGFNLAYAQMLTADISPEQLTCSSAGILNHPAWTLGHLIQGSDFAALLLGLDSAVSDDWAGRFGRGSTPVDDPTAYPNKAELLKTLEEQHARVSEALKNTDSALLTQPMPDEEFRQIMPTIGDGLGYILVSHEATHLGQLSAWRRTVGLPTVF